MNTKHVPCLELCQEFDTLCKEEGIVVPETEFYWENQAIAGSNPFVLVAGKPSRGVEMYPAPLVSEQGELLPWTLAGVDISGDVNVSIEFQKVGDTHGVMYVENNETVASFKDDHIEQWDDNEANARQKMINYLIAKGIITKL